MRGEAVEDAADAGRRRVARVTAERRGADAPSAGVVAHVARLQTEGEAAQAPESLGDVTPGSGPPPKVSVGVRLFALVSACVLLVALLQEQLTAPTVRVNRRPAAPVPPSPAPETIGVAGQPSARAGTRTPARPTSLAARPGATSRPSSTATPIGADGEDADDLAEEDAADDLDDDIDEEIDESIGEGNSTGGAPDAGAAPASDAGPSTAPDGGGSPALEPAELASIQVTVGGVESIGVNGAVVRGTVTNSGQAAVWGARITIMLMDGFRVVGQRAVDCCDALPGVDLAQVAAEPGHPHFSPFVKVAERRIPPGGAVPFVAVFRGVPAEAVGSLTVSAHPTMAFHP